MRRYSDKLRGLPHVHDRASLPMVESSLFARAVDPCYNRVCFGGALILLPTALHGHILVNAAIANEEGACSGHTKAMQAM